MRKRQKRRKLKYTIVVYLILTAVSVGLFFVAHNYAETLRTNSGYGGELTAFLLPFTVWAIRENIILSKKERNNNET